MAIHPLESGRRRNRTNSHVFPFVSSMIEDVAYAEAKRIFLEAIRKAGKVDVICKCFHGSMYKEAVEDPDIWRS